MANGACAWDGPMGAPALGNMQQLSLAPRLTGRPPSNATGAPHAGGHRAHVPHALDSLRERSLFCYHFITHSFDNRPAAAALTCCPTR